MVSWYVLGDKSENEMVTDHRADEEISLDYQTVRFPVGTETGDERC